MSAFPRRQMEWGVMTRMIWAIYDSHIFDLLYRIDADNEERIREVLILLQQNIQPAVNLILIWEGYFEK